MTNLLLGAILILQILTLGLVFMWIGIVKELFEKHKRSSSWIERNYQNKIEKN